jgi:predicted glutamine amidotransferase
MCQLTFVNLQNQRYNSLLEYIMSIQNSSSLNKDGYGLHTRTAGLFKSGRKPLDLVGTGAMLHEFFVDAEPIMSHVRQATTTAGKRLVDDAHTHPFESTNLILGHNGSLEQKIERLPLTLDKPTWDNMIDSQRFLYLLEKEYEKNPSITKALTLTMDQFIGKFAFMIYEKKTSKYYAVKGRTAELHIAYLLDGKKRIGYVINTNKTDLDTSLVVFTNLLAILGHEVSFSEITPLEDEAIFLLGDTGIRMIGKVFENYRPIVTVYSEGRSWQGGRSFPATTVSEDQILSEQAKYLLRFMPENKLSIRDVDEICYTLYGIPFLGLTEPLITNLVRQVLPGLARRNDKGKAKIWQELLKMNSAPGIYTRYKLDFPYFLNDFKQLKQALREEGFRVTKAA